MITWSFRFLVQSMQRSEDIPQSLEPPGIAHSALGGNNSGPNLTRSTSTTLSPDIPDSPASEFSSASSVDTGSFSSTQSGMTNNELFAAANRDRDSIGRSAVLKGSQVDSSLSQGGVGYADGPNPATLPSELTDPALQTSVKPSEMSTVREHLDAPHSIHNTNPNGERTEGPYLIVLGLRQRADKVDQAQMVIGKRAAAPSRNDDISHFISNVSEQAAFISGRFGDIFTAVHKEVGKIALKRLRVGDTDKEKGALRVRVTAPGVSLSGRLMPLSRALRGRQIRGVACTTPTYWSFSALTNGESIFILSVRLSRMGRY